MPSTLLAAADDKQAFVASIARDHGQRLRRFLASRLRHAAADVPDLIQEVYLRLLRVPHQESIRNPQAYMFTIAFHVLQQHKLALADAPRALDPLPLPIDPDAIPDNDPARQVETRERLGRLEKALRELPDNVYATFVLQRRYGFSLEEIGRELGVSRAMVKKYLARAVAHCRERFDGVK